VHLVGFIIRTIGTSDNLIKLIDFFFFAGQTVLYKRWKDRSFIVQG